jgi:hypothetical protein
LTISEAQYDASKAGSSNMCCRTRTFQGANNSTLVNFDIPMRSP